jgi:hypothetical protein
MKKALAVVLALVCIGFCTDGAQAQVPFMQVYFDADYNDTQSQCLLPGTLSSLYLAALNLNMFYSALDFKISFPPALMWIGDSPNVDPINDLVIGNSPAGMAIAYSLPKNGFQTQLLNTMAVLWTANCNCALGPQPMVVVGFEPLINPNPTVVQWPATVQVPVVGMTSLICPGAVSTSATTWGGVKALYR